MSVYRVHIVIGALVMAAVITRANTSIEAVTQVLSLYDELPADFTVRVNKTSYSELKGWVRGD